MLLGAISNTATLPHADHADTLKKNILQFILKTII